MNPRHQRGFNLLEVMIALTIFFMVAFSILAVVSASLRNARALRLSGRPNAGMLAGELSLTNKVEEGIESGDFGDLYPDFRWEREIYEAGTNGLFQVDFVIYRQGNHSKPDSAMSILVYRPGSQTRRLGVQPAP